LHQENQSAIQEFCWQKEEDEHLPPIRSFDDDDDLWKSMEDLMMMHEKNVEDLKECFDSRDTLKTYGFSYLGFVICVCYLK